MKVFLTGGTGFIGQWVVPILVEHGHELRMLLLEDDKNPFSEMKNVSIVRGGLNEINYIESMMRDFEPDSLVHLAWEGLPDYSPKMCFHNFELSLNLFKVAAGIVKKSILSTGSCWEYASRNGEQSEDSALGPPAVFPAVKNALRFMGEAIALEREISFYWLRLFFVYGPGQKNQSLIPSIINSVKKGDFPQIKAPENLNDFVYVEDAARAVMEILRSNPKSTVFNVGSGYSTEVKEVLKMVCEGMNQPFDGKLLRNNSLNEDFWADISRITRETDWCPEYGLKRGIRRTLEYMKRMNS